MNTYCIQMLVVLHRMESQERLLRMAQKKRLFRLSEASAAGVHPEYVRRLTRLGQLTRVGRGLYALPTLEPTEHHTLAEVAKRVPKAVFCLLTTIAGHACSCRPAFPVRCVPAILS